MNKKTVVICIFFAFSVSLNLVTPIKKLIITRSLTRSIYNYDMIDNKETALEYALLIFAAEFEDDTYSLSRHESYHVFYNNFLNVWFVIGILPDNTLGGVPSLIFEKSGRILSLLHTYG